MSALSNRRAADPADAPIELRNWPRLIIARMIGMEERGGVSHSARGVAATTMTMRIALRRMLAKITAIPPYPIIAKTTDATVYETSPAVRSMPMSRKRMSRARRRSGMNVTRSIAAGGPRPRR